MSKYGKLIAIGATTLLAAAGTLSAGIFMSSARNRRWWGDGYVFLSSDWQSTQSEKSGSEETAPESYYFSGGTKVRGKFPNELVFRHRRNKAQHRKGEFLHYADGSASATSNGVLVVVL